ncbi:putative membrane protein [Hordeum vulgare]|nr:putative membrane protein [Hordeum vulgare]
MDGVEEVLGVLEVPAVEEMLGVLEVPAVEEVLGVLEVFSLWAESDRKYGGLSLSSEDVLCIPILFAYPYMTYLSGPGLSIVLNIASVIKNNLSVTIITGTFILQNNVVPQNQRGAANGLAMTGMSFFKAVAPAGAGIVGKGWRPSKVESGIDVCVAVLEEVAQDTATTTPVPSHRHPPVVRCSAAIGGATLPLPLELHGIDQGADSFGLVVLSRR